MGSVVNTRGRNLGVPVLGEQEGICVTGAFLELLLLHLSTSQGALAEKCFLFFQL